VIYLQSDSGPRLSLTFLSRWPCQHLLFGKAWNILQLILIHMKTSNQPASLRVLVSLCKMLSGRYVVTVGIEKGFLNIVFFNQAFLSWCSRNISIYNFN